MNEPENPLQTIFSEALEIEDAQQRAAFVAQACGADVALRREIEELLQASTEARGFLPDKPAAGGVRAALLATTEALGSGGATPLGIVTEQPGDRIGRYKLLQRIGEGGCGVVYMAEQEEPVRRKVALKVIKLGMDTKQVVGRFEAERQALALMDHPSIAKVLDAGATDTGRPFFVMELVRGTRITDYCDQNALATCERLELFIKVCQAVQHAHQKGVIHRDLKPSNILVTENDGVPVPKVIDFGIAKATGGRLTDQTLFTAFEQFLGTPAYMSPEQTAMTSHDIDTRSDIYSLGVLLYELLTGTTPFDTKALLATGVDELRRTIREQKPVRPSTRLGMPPVAANANRLKSNTKRKECNADLDRAEAPPSLQRKELIRLIRGDLDWITMKCLEKDRARRYETANGLANDIRRHLNCEPVLARPPSRLYEFQKTVRRHKFGFAATAAVITTLAAGVLVSTREAVRASRAEREQFRLRQQAQTQEIISSRRAYASDMNLAQQAWEQDNIGRVRQLLEESQEFPDRGFEWYYWQRQSHQAWKTYRGHLEEVSSVAFSPDGQRIVTSGRDRTAKVWDVAASKEPLCLEEHSGWINSVAFSPDGQRVLTGSEDQTTKVWEAASGRHVLTLMGHTGAINAVALSPDGQRIVTGSDDLTARVWEAASGRELVTLKGHTGSIWSVAFSPDGRRIVTGSRDQTAKVWEAASGRELVTLKGHSGSIWSVAFSPDCQRIVTGSRDQTARLWEAASGRGLLTLKGHGASVNSVGFSPDGQRIITGSGDRTARVWETATGRELLTLKEHSAGINSVAYSPDGQQIITGSQDRTAKVWNVTDGQEPLTLKGLSGWINSAAISPDGQRIVSGIRDQTAKVWEAASGRELVTLKGHSGRIQSVAFSRDGQLIVTGSEDEVAKVWEAANGRELATLKGHSGPIWSVAFSPDGQQIVTGSEDKSAKVWEAASGRELVALNGHGAPINSVAFSPDGRQIVTGSQDLTASVWDVASGRDLLMLKGHAAPVNSVAFSPDGRRIVTGSHDQTARVWELASGRELLTLKGHNGPIYSVAFSPDGRRIVTGSDDLTAKVWESDSGRDLLTLKGHSRPIWSVRFSLDGQRIITGSEDQPVKLWVAARAEQVATWQEDERRASRYLAGLQREREIVPERQRIARARDEGAIKRWLILAPLALATGQSGAEGVDTEQIEGEAGLCPKAGERRVVANGELKWQEAAQEDYAIDFNAMLGRMTARSVAYAVCYIRSETAQRDLQMLVGSDDQAKVYLNGKQIYKFPFGRRFVADHDKVPDLALNAGLNILVFKVVNQSADWQGSVRFTDAQGKPVKGITVTLTP